MTFNISLRVGIVVWYVLLMFWTPMPMAETSSVSEPSSADWRMVRGLSRKAGAQGCARRQAC
jgi:hypothetical protein